MNVENEMLSKMGTCIYPVGDCKTLCGEPTLLDKDGGYTPFCSKHSKEIEERFKSGLQKRKKKKGSFRGSARVYT